MSSEHPSSDNGTVARFMQVLSESTPRDKARLPSYRMIWLKAQWARQQEKEQKVARVRLFIEGTVQVLVALALVILGVTHRASISAWADELFSGVLSSGLLLQSAVLTGAALTTVTLVVALQAIRAESW